jgi:hypothetical protein
MLSRAARTVSAMSKASGGGDEQDCSGTAQMAQGRATEFVLEHLPTIPLGEPAKK